MVHKLGIPGSFDRQGISVQLLNRKKVKLIAQRVLTLRKN